MRGVVAALGLSAVAVVLTACGDPDDGSNSPVTQPTTTTGSAPAAIDGLLDCGPGEGWSETYTFAEDAVGSPTPEAALDEGMSRWLRGDAEVHAIGATTASVVRDGREVVVGRAVSALAGGWLLESAEGCADS